MVFRGGNGDVPLHPGADEAEHLANASLNSCLEKGGHSIKST